MHYFWKILNDKVVNRLLLFIYFFFLQIIVGKQILKNDNKNPVFVIRFTQYFNQTSKILKYMEENILYSKNKYNAQ